MITGRFVTLHLNQSPPFIICANHSYCFFSNMTLVILLSHATGQKSKHSVSCPCYRAHLVKRKMDTMKEERRRQDILTKRREQIREATERYQRLKKNYMPESGGLYPCRRMMFCYQGWQHHLPHLSRYIVMPNRLPISRAIISSFLFYILKNLFSLTLSHLASFLGCRHSSTSSYLSVWLLPLCS